MGILAGIAYFVNREYPDAAMSYNVPAHILSVWIYYKDFSS